jgi:hypothetical protein
MKSSFGGIRGAEFEAFAEARWAGVRPGGGELQGHFTRITPIDANSGGGRDGEAFVRGFQLAAGLVSSAVLLRKLSGRSVPALMA